MAELSTTVASSFGRACCRSSHTRGTTASAETTEDSVRHHGILALVAIVGERGLRRCGDLVGYGSQYHSAIVPMLILLPGMWFLGTG